MEIARRHYFTHHAHRSVGVSALPEAFRQRRAAAKQEADPNGGILRVLFVAAPLEERLEEAIWGLRQCFDGAWRWQCGRAFCSPGALSAEHLENGDCLLVVLSTVGELATWQSAVDPLVRQGKGVVAIGLSASVSRDRSLARPAPGSAEHSPLRHGARHVAVAGPLPNLEVPDDGRIVLSCAEGPVAWCAQRGTGGLFCLWLGQAAGLMQLDVRRLLCDAVRWAAGR